MERRTQPSVSVVIPAFNEQGSVRPLFDRLKEVIPEDSEVIFVDDGSTDRTFDVLMDVHKADSRVKIVRFRRNFGQSAAMDAGFRMAKAQIIVSMDADLQNDPKDIPRLLRKLDEGFDVVSGWRKDRRDPLFKRMFSRLANALRKRLTDDRIHDAGCSLKAYRREALQDVSLYGEMHRYLISLLIWRGFRVGEIVVKHHPRKFGKTKYSSSRLVKGFLDLLVLKYWRDYSSRPVHFFGSLGLISGLLGTIICAYLVVLKFMYRIAIMDRPLLFLGILMIVVGVQFFIFGVLADILMKQHYDGTGRTVYSIERVVE
ncbi:MAG: glycosyltransferase family 2 protein [Nanoarchaeota archaeon]